MPFIGLSSFYKGNKFDGWCELINSAMTVISIIAACCCHTRDSNCVAVYIAIITIVIELTKIFHMMTIGSADMYEIAILIISIILVYLYCCCVDYNNNMHTEACGIIPAILVTLTTGALETFRDVYTAANYDNDGNDCPFI